MDVNDFLGESGSENEEIESLDESSGGSVSSEEQVEEVAKKPVAKKRAVKKVSKAVSPVEGVGKKKVVSKKKASVVDKRPEKDSHYKTKKDLFVHIYPELKAEDYATLSKKDEKRVKVDREFDRYTKEEYGPQLKAWEERTGGGAKKKSKEVDEDRKMDKKVEELSSVVSLSDAVKKTFDNDLRNLIEQLAVDCENASQYSLDRAKRLRMMCH